jgi:hypothetical protein
MARATVSADSAISSRMKRKMMRIHASQPRPATPMAPIMAAEVGITRLVNPSPSWKHSTLTCLLTPTSSPRPAISGMVIVACALPELTKKLNTDCAASMPQAATSSGVPSMALPMA